MIEPIEQKKLSKLLGKKEGNAEMFYQKFEDVVKGGLREYGVREVTTIVWAMLVKNYKLEGEFWRQIESWIYEQLAKPEATVKDAALVMWAYANQKPLLGSTFKRIT